MARGLITPTAVSKAGVAPPSETDGDAVNFHYIPNDGKVVLIVRNSNGAATARVLTINLNGSVDGQAITPKTVSVPAGATRYIGPFDTTRYGTSLNIDPDNAELKISAIRLP